MPSLTSPLPPPSKKRRFSDADDDDDAAPTPEQHLAILSGGGVPRRWERPDARARERPERWGLTRRIVPVLPLAKRARGMVAEEERRRMKSPTRGGGDNNNTVDAGAGKLGKTTSLAACHICHRRPTKKSVLDSFADCEGCGERTCFVCIRECAGPRFREASGLQQQQQQDDHHHQRQDQLPQQQQQGAGDEDAQDLSRSFCMDDADADERRDKVGVGEEEDWGAGGHRVVVCSRCCVEMGHDGEIACLGCLSRMEGV